MRQVDGKVTDTVCHVDPVSTHTVICAKPLAITGDDEILH
jgi:hypothetical protein